jgi:hypothetical protein
MFNVVTFVNIQLTLMKLTTSWSTVEYYTTSLLTELRNLKWNIDGNPTYGVDELKGMLSHLPVKH